MAVWKWRLDGRKDPVAPIKSKETATHAAETGNLGRWPLTGHHCGKQSTEMGSVGQRGQLPVISCITRFVVLTPSVPWHGLARERTVGGRDWRDQTLVPANKRRLVSGERKGRRETALDARHAKMINSAQSFEDTSRLKVIRPQWWSRLQAPDEKKVERYTKSKVYLSKSQ